MADDGANGNHTRTSDLVDTVFTLHDRLTTSDLEIDAHEEWTNREIRKLTASVSELRRLILLFGVIALVSVIVSMLTTIHVITTVRG